jgi:hypothetical protein
VERTPELRLLDCRISIHHLVRSPLHHATSLASQEPRRAPFPNSAWILGPW